MKFKMLIVSIVIFIIGIGVGIVTTPEKEVIIEKEVEVKSPIEGLAKEYLLEFIDISNKVNALPYHEEQYQTTIGMRTLASQEYEMWDVLLNDIYNKLKEVLSTEEMDKLMEEQLKWIEDRDTKAEEEGKKYEGGTMQPLMITSAKASYTRERCLELIKTYME